jgi:hypothetical protein
VRTIRAWLDERRARTTPFDIIWESDTPGDDPARAADTVRPWAEAGLTWWLESVWQGPRTCNDLAGMRERIAQGPSRIG